MKVSPFSSIPQIPVAAPGETQRSEPGAFKAILESSIGKVEGMRMEADKAVDRFLGGEQEDVHTVALATQRAELAFDMFLQVRNKVVQAYQEVMRMQM
jgi:flagellar hook-basal body complex protein FliE